MKKPCEITLVYVDESQKDDYGNPIRIETQKEIFAERSSITLNEFYQSANTSFKPEIKFEIYEEEFQNAEYLIYENVKYSVIRTYQRTLDRLELVCERRLGNEVRQTN